MSWTVDIAAMPREQFPAVMDEHRRSNGGSMPNKLVDVIVDEASYLGVAFTKVALASFGHCGDGDSPRYARFDVTGSS